MIIMAVSQEILDRLQAQIDALDKRLRYDGNDLEYETHLQKKRELQRTLDILKKKAGS